MARTRRQREGRTSLAVDRGAVGPTGLPRRRRRAPWWRGKAPIFRFALLYAFFLGLFYAMGATSLMRETVFPTYLRWNASASAAVLSVFEGSVGAVGKTVSGRTSLTIERGCDAIEPSALFIAGVLAFPAAWRMKIPGILIGTLALMILNLARIFSLYYIRLWAPSLFDIMHVQVWQAAFIFLAILFWILWAVWAIGERRPAHAPAATD